MQITQFRKMTSLAEISHDASFILSNGRYFASVASPSLHTVFSLPPELSAMIEAWHLVALSIVAVGIAVRAIKLIMKKLGWPKG